MMKSLVLSAAVASLWAGAANAMPVAKLATPVSDVISVAGGCGAGWHRGPYGACVRNRAAYYRPPVYYAPPPPPPPRRCWWVVGPYGNKERVCTW